MTKRVLTTIADVEKAMNELQTVEAQLDAETATANQEIAHIREGVVESVSSLEEQKKRLRTMIESWAEANRDDAEIFPPNKKSLDLQAGTISFRMGTEKVVLKKGIKTDHVIETAQELGLKKILTTPDPELDKKAVKDLYEAGKLSDADLKKLGIEIKQDENVNIKLNTIEAYA